MQITIEKIIYPGKSLARENGKIFLTDEGLPGERVEIAVVKEKKNYNEATTQSVITPSAHRVAPRCSHFKICSPYQIINYPYQVHLKETQLRQILGHAVKTDLPFEEMQAAQQIWGYRNKIHLHIIRGNGVRPAYHSPGSHDQFTAINECFLASPNMNALISACGKIISRDSLNGVRQITIRENHAKNQLLLALSGHLPADEQQRAAGGFKQLAGNLPLAGIIYADEKKHREQLLWGSSFINDVISGKTFHYGAASFFQINPAMLELLIHDLRSSIPFDTGKNVIDYFCGTGLFGIIIAPLAARVTGIESNPRDIFFLKKNIAENAVTNFVIRKEDCRSSAGRSKKDPADIIIADPPRNGLGYALCAALIQKKARHIAYISCDPATLARDYKALLNEYELRRVFAYDFFPHTPHIETLSIFELK
jgi:23S rRNA (uracil1939-C5)-methyltransferase